MAVAMEHEREQHVTPRANAELSVSVLNGVIDPFRYGPKVSVTVDLGGATARLEPRNIDPDSGSFSFHDTPALRLSGLQLESIWEEELDISLHAWHPVTSWRRVAEIRIPVQTVGIGAPESEYRTFLLDDIDGVDTDDEESKPRLFLSVRLRSEFRPPVQTAARLLEGYTSTVDRALDAFSEQTAHLVPYLSSRYALVPTIPMGVFVLASLPLLCVLGVAGFPLLVPLLLVGGAVTVILGLLAGAVWAGSRGGRSRIQAMAKPVLEKVGDNPEVLYPIGPSPSPIRIVRALMPTTMWPKLVASVMVDFIGCTSYAVPILGESADLLWAPMSLILIDAMYHDSSPWAGWFGAVEELLPFTDIIPTATLAWLKEYGPCLISELRGILMGKQEGRKGDIYHSDGGSMPEHDYPPRHEHSS